MNVITYRYRPTIRDIIHCQGCGQLCYRFPDRGSNRCSWCVGKVVMQIDALLDELEQSRP